MWVQSLVKELRSCMMCSTVKKKKKTGKEKPRSAWLTKKSPLKIACLVGQHSLGSLFKPSRGLSCITWVLRCIIWVLRKCENKRKTVHAPQHTGHGLPAATQAEWPSGPFSLTPSLSPSLCQFQKLCEAIPQPPGHLSDFTVFELSNFYFWIKFHMHAKKVHAS